MIDEIFEQFHTSYTHQQEITIYRRKRRRKNTKHLEKKGLGNQHVQCVGKREGEFLSISKE